MEVKRPVNHWTVWLTLVVRVVRALSIGGKMSLSGVSEASETSERNVKKILRKLRRMGYIDSSTGRNGGYWLIKPIARITLRDLTLLCFSRIDLPLDDGCQGRVSSALRIANEAFLLKLAGISVSEILLEGDSPLD